MAEPTSSEYRFGRYRLLPGGRSLLADDQAVRLGSRAFDALLVLVEQRERAVPKAELMERVWPRLVVEDNNLQVQIAALRKVLGAGAIATIPGRGYRFTLPVEAHEARESPAIPHTPAAPVAAQAARHDNLPQMPGPLYGRDRDLAAVGALLDAHALVCVVGAGGIGKTRLAIEVARMRRADYEDGAWLVELASVGDPTLVGVEVSRVLSLALSGERIDADTLATALAAQRMLLLLDNCEHLLEAVASLADALSRRAPGVRVLVTSQEPLKLAAERVYRLDPLTVPASPALADAEGHGSIALFADRAQAADPRFRLTLENLRAVIEICRRLDGIPLALELAAARVPLLGVEGVRARLDERFHILTGGSRFVLRRHQTLRAALDFSHGLLDERERAVLRRAGIFAGSFGVDLAQAVCAHGALDPWEVLDCLGALVDKSLVVAETGSTPRLRLLETTRAYALEKLGDAGETGAVLELHAAAMAFAVRRMYEDYLDLAPDDWLRRYEPDLDNLRAAIEWSLLHAPARAIELVGNSLKIWQELALHPEARRYCALALALIAPDTPAVAAGRLWYAEAMLAANGMPRRSRDAARNAIALLRDSGDEIVFPMSLARLAGWSRGMVSEEQLAALHELEGLERPDWRGQMRWLVPYIQGVVLRTMRRFDEANRCYVRSIGIMRDQGDLHAELRTLVNLAESVLMGGEAAEAARIAADVRQRLAHSHDPLFYMFASMAQVSALLFTGSLLAAREPLVAAVPLMLRYDLFYRFAKTAALYAALSGDLACAARLLGYAQATYETRDIEQDIAEVEAGERAGALLAAVPQAQRETWMAEGGLLSGGDAYRAVLRSDDPPTAG